MTTTLAPAAADLLPQVLAAWLAGKADRTRIEYQKCVRAFADFVGFAVPADAVAALLAGTRGDAARTAELWKGAMLTRGLAAATTNQKLAALRSLVEAARRYGVIEWSLDVDGVKAEPRRDARGCSWVDYERVVAATESRRDVAILRLLGDRALRRAEVAALEIDDVGGGEIRVTGKGRREKETLTLNARTTDALAWWIEERGTEPGSLFGVAKEQIHAIVAAAGKRVGLALHPHSLRHAGITRALDVTGGDVRKVQRFSRHASVATVIAYDDARNRHEAVVAALVGGST